MKMVITVKSNGGYGIAVIDTQGNVFYEDGEGWLAEDLIISLPACISEAEEKGYKIDNKKELMELYESSKYNTPDEWDYFESVDGFAKFMI